MTDDDVILPKGATFRWESGTFLATNDSLYQGSNTITSALAGRGLAVAGSGSTTGNLIPFPAKYAANVRLTRAMTAGEARGMIEQAFRDVFTFLGAVTSSFDQISGAVAYTIAATTQTIADDTRNAAKAAFPMTVALSIGAVAIAAAVLAVKFG